MIGLVSCIVLTKILRSSHIPTKHDVMKNMIMVSMLEEHYNLPRRESMQEDGENIIEVKNHRNKIKLTLSKIA